MNVAIAKIRDVLLAYRHAQSLSHEIFTTLRQVELTGTKDCGTTIECFVEFYCEFEAIPASSDSPGEPAQYAIASVTAVEYRLNENGFRDTTPIPLPTPSWLEDMLIECIDVDSLARDAQ
jgi:hypothetical protein